MWQKTCSQRKINSCQFWQHNRAHISQSQSGRTLSEGMCDRKAPPSIYNSQIILESNEAQANKRMNNKRLQMKMTATLAAI